MIGIFGGSFNPPHRGHLELVAYALRQPEIEAVWVIPCWEHPFGKSLIRFEDRLEMCRLQFHSFGARAVVSAVEQELGGKSWMLRTVQHLKQLHPGKTFLLLIGADLLAEMPRWDQPEKLRGEIDFCVVPRGKGSPIVNVSASDIRRKIAAGENLKTVLTDDVVDYIEKHRLYRGEP